jgi:phi13 family phage major tail protein
MAPYVALLYKANKSNGEARYQVLYKGKFELPEESAKTKEGTTDFQTPVMTAIFQPTKHQMTINGKKKALWKYQVDTDDPDCPTTIDTDFFTDVIQPTEKLTTP